MKSAGRPLPTLADEIMAALPSITVSDARAATARFLAQHLGSDIASVRRAMAELNADARASLMRRPDSRRMFLVPFLSRGAPDLRCCAQCGNLFGLRPKGDRRVCCTRACGVAWSWNRPGVRERRSAGIKTQKQTPEAMAALAAHNARRWSKPGEREKLAEQNRKEWRDPIKGKLRAQSIAIVQRSPKMRNLYSELRKVFWADPAMREKMLAGIRESKRTPEARAKFSALLSERWKDPAWRKKWLAAVRRNGARGAAKIKGRKQSAEQIAARVASFKRTRALKASGATA